MVILDYFKLPQKAQVNQRVYTKDIITALNATGSEKALIEKSISQVYLSGIIREDTTGLWAVKNDTYFYEEIDLFHITIKDKSKVKLLNEQIQKVFPNPIIVIYEYGNEYLLSTAMKRLNKIEKGKTVIDSIQTTDWFKLDKQHEDLLNNINYQRKDLKDFYEYIDFVISSDYILKVTGRIPEVIDFTVKAKSLTIQQLLEEKSKLTIQEAEESSMQGKMQCHMRIKEIEKQLEMIK